MSAVEEQPDNGAKRSAKWQLRRQEIIDTSARVFARTGFHGTSTADLCAANGIGKGALYYYIGSKEELLVAIHDRVMDEVIAAADRVAAEDGTPPEQLAAHGAALLEIIHRYPDHVWVFLHEFPALTGAYAEEFRKRRRQYEDRIRAVFRAGSESGDFRGIDPKMAATAWLGMHNYTYLWLRGTSKADVRQLAADYADIFVSGVRKQQPPGQAVRQGAGPASGQGARARRTRRPR